MKILKRTKAMKDAHIAHGIRSFLTHFNEPVGGEA